MTSRRAFLQAVTASGIALLERRASARTRRDGVQPAPFRGTTPGQGREVERIALCWCPPGQFLMGSPDSETDRRPDEAQVRVTLTRGFWMAKFEVTQGQWARVMGSLPATHPTAKFGIGDTVPVYWVRYVDAEEFCRRLTARAAHSGAMPGGWQFRLPTEAQWEYACRAGTTTAFSFGSRLGLDQANIGRTPDAGGRSPVGRATVAGAYPPNPWSICDMHGNIFEWCRDWYHAQLPGGTDPDLSGRKGAPNRDGTYSRVRRGGAWNDEEKFCRSALRLRYEPERNSDHIGFRYVAVEEG
ncbi:MAG: formylglycine-generating enzyme family protein [Vicinamibacterales bacterium]